MHRNGDYGARMTNTTSPKLYKAKVRWKRSAALLRADAKMNANMDAVIKEAEANCIRLTGKKRF